MSRRRNSYFYPRSPRGERRSAPSWKITQRKAISIHAPRVGSDPEIYIDHDHGGEFLSTLPAWGATGRMNYALYARFDFYPRSPRGERPK